MLVLGIETSCDETGVALYDSDKGLLAEALYSQVEQHAVFGGVVPELASRDHVQKILPLIQSILDQANIKTSDINGVAYTAGPGLVGALLVGAMLGRSLAMAWGIPAIAIHHMEGHLLAPMLEPDSPEFPFVALLVSGGHTQLIRVSKFGEYTILGDTVDDAIGECFDKVARLLGLGYPGGAALERLAKSGDSAKYRFPRPMVRHQGMDFSFSGLKTFAANTLKKEPDDEKTHQNVARALQDAIVDTLVIKCRRALEFTKWKTLVVAGGVSANEAIRVGLSQLLEKKGGRAYFPRHSYCTDNGAMIAYAGCQRLMRGDSSAGLSVKVYPRWPLADL